MIPGELVPLVAVGVPLAGTLGLTLLPEIADRRRNCWTVSCSLAVAVAVAVAAVTVFRGGRVEAGPWPLVSGLAVHLRLDPLGALFALIASSLWVLATLYSTGYMAHEDHRRRYSVFWLLSLGVTMGLAFAANLFTLYLFYEMLTLSTYPLVVHAGSPEAARAGWHYLGYSFAGAALVLGGFVVLAGLLGPPAFVAGGAAALLPAGAYPALRLAFSCLALGFAVKAAMIPLHGWLPLAMVAPTPVSALLHAVAVVKAGVFGLLRTWFSLFGPETVAALGMVTPFLTLAAITIGLGSVLALQQQDLKRRLAYSTVSQLAYIPLGVALLSPAGVAGGLVHLINHALMKITLFFCAGIIITQTGRTQVNQLSGVGRRLPLTMLAFAVAALGMIGVIPVNGFVSKWQLVVGALHGGEPWVLALLAASALLNAAYYLPIVAGAFFREGGFDPPPEGAQEAPLSMLGPVILLALACLLTGFFPGWTLGLVRAVGLGL
ncbi:MAG: proton-conducting transporter membrane subunit [bacterium]|nr:proton-conducting transporter membrane subunit [bacterium]